MVNNQTSATNQTAKITIAFREKNKKMTKQPPTNLEQFVNNFNGNRFSRVLDIAVDFYQDLVRNRTTESYFDAQQFTELHQQISESLDKEGLSDEERTDIAFLGISLSNWINKNGYISRNFDSSDLSQAHKNFVIDIATRPGVNHAKILNHAIPCLDAEGVELLVQKSVANLPAESLVEVADGIDFQSQNAKLFARFLIREQANANKELRNTVQRGLGGSQNIATQQLSQHVGRGGL